MSPRSLRAIFTNATSSSRTGSASIISNSVVSNINNSYRCCWTRETKQRWWRKEAAEAVAQDSSPSTTTIAPWLGCQTAELLAQIFPLGDWPHRQIDSRQAGQRIFDGASVSASGGRHDGGNQMCIQTEAALGCLEIWLERKVGDGNHYHYDCNYEEEQKRLQKSNYY